ncbi:hypothetical protein BCR33DRAFT_711547 [Rhizoclosmatium globosum]|uniref:RRM domain-containing protein n=1 Tax=Rhizoclosmatium globosum TaxID=329046 RepID=A0A1Y2D1S5_9FUNG|nr:hypothetical protein BCR33DRAFT_711547 [Rhizoclosmatium globosum]|eukprot:ORY53210.1 hypothetical protein BCR33DRAFT_711547 [Rhizoclosmatium globosum]
MVYDLSPPQSLDGSSHLLNQPHEEISTIFVVGFPEDIQDREFQNMFIFAPGFEAATLKFPANFDADDGIPAYKKQIIGFAKFKSRKEANYARDFLTGRKVDVERGSILKAEIAKKNLHIKRANADFNNPPMTPTAYNVPSSNGVSMMSNVSSLPLPSPAMAPFRQPGYNKQSSFDNSFSEYSSVNSPLPWDILNDEDSASSAGHHLQQQHQHQQQHQQYQHLQQQQQQQSMRNAQLGGNWGSLHSRTHSSSTDLMLDSQQNHQQHYSNPKHSLGSSPTDLDAEVEILAQPPSLDVGSMSSFRSVFEASMSLNSNNNQLNGSNGNGTTAINISSGNSDLGNQQDKTGTSRFASRMNSLTNTSGFSSALFSSESLLSLPPGLKINTKNNSSPNTSSGPMTAPVNPSSSLLSGLGNNSSSMHHSNDRAPLPLSINTGSNRERELSISNGTVPTPNGNNNPPALSSKFPPLSISIPTSASANGNGMGPIGSQQQQQQQQPQMTPTTLNSAPVFSANGVTAAGIASAGFRCPADQNPPCNTLYVGNLATNTNETELRELFQRCPGYKRMSFRARPNGPMVFVEFENIAYAQQALGDLHGTLLSTSVKGGIRLSFSKNPLGVRPNGLTTPIGNGMVPPSPSTSMHTPMGSSNFFDSGF